MAKPLVLFHGGCTDGLTAAWVAVRSLGDAEAIPVLYGAPPPEVTGRDVYILDFSYKRPVMEAIRDKARSLIVLDHHVTAKDDLEGLLPPVSRTSRSGMIFDMSRSGARLAWDFFVAQSIEHWASEGAPCPLLGRAEWLVDHVQDRDLWEWALPNSRLVSAAIEAYPRTFEAWDRLAAMRPQQLALDGKVIENYRERCIEAAVELARWVSIGGLTVQAANVSEMRFASDTAHQLALGKQFGATYWIRKDGRVQFSLRSTDGGVDVSGVAKTYGGGGHVHAAGFEVDMPAFLDIMGLTVRETGGTA